MMDIREDGSSFSTQNMCRSLCLACPAVTRVDVTRKGFEVSGAIVCFFAETMATRSKRETGP